MLGGFLSGFGVCVSVDGFWEAPPACELTADARGWTQIRSALVLINYGGYRGGLHVDPTLQLFLQNLSHCQNDFREP